MRALVQRVRTAEVHVSNKLVGAIIQGLLVFVSIGKNDTETTVAHMIDQIIAMRIFSDERDKMNKSLLDIHGQLLLVSQFTLHADTSSGNRPSFTHAASRDHAKVLYEYSIAYAREKGLVVETGEFGAHMEVTLTNDGPVTIWLDSEV